MNTVTLDVKYLSPSTIVAIIQDLIEGGYGIRIYDTPLFSQLESLVGKEEARRMLDESNPFISGAVYELTDGQEVTATRLMTPEQVARENEKANYPAHHGNWRWQLNPNLS